ncbi:ATP synthase F1 subunit gamma [Sphingobacteriaceae bacterium AH-315-L07]|nr:ATP synthase F1 subunit gamma [Sphingobacteriaceae bacterium AH-315-L07]
MANLKEVRIRITSVISTQQITKAMKMVSAAKLRRAQEAIVQMRPYANKLSEIFSNLSANIDDESANKFSNEREVNKVLLVSITSNRGLCGGFNSNVIKSVNNLLSDKYASQHANGNVHLLCIGKKGHDVLSKKGIKVIAEHNDIYNKVEFESVAIVAETIMDQYLDGDYDKVEIIYNQFKNAGVQILKNEQFLPIPKAESSEKNGFSANYIFEPTQEFIVQELIPKSLKTQLFKAILDSIASEHGARMTAMDNATENASELLKELRLTYNKARQAAITTEILEISSGAEALAS